MVTDVKTKFQWHQFPHVHFLPFPQGLGPRGKRIEMSRDPQFQEQKYSPRRLGGSQYTSSLPPLKKKRHFWGLYHTKNGSFQT